MNKPLKLTVIVPVYNNEERVEACLRSIRGQSYGDYEAIVVDDGSADCSASVASDFCEGDDRFRFVARSHGGVSAARNAGLDIARGEYVTFVDADDVLPKDSFKHMHQSTVIYDADTVCGVYERVDGITTYRNGRSYNLANKTRRIQADDLDLIHSWSLCNKWLSMGIIKREHLRFEPLSHLEDGVFLYSYLRHAKAIYACPHTVYTYRKPLPFEGRTTTQGARPELLRDAKTALGRLKELTADYGSAFEAELDYRFLNTPLIGDYYQRLWKTDDDFASILAGEVNAQLSLLDDEHRERVLATHADVLAPDGVRTKEDFLSAPLVSVIVERGVTGDVIAKLIEGLYDQAELSFEALVEQSLREAIPDEFAAMPNLSFWRGSEQDALGKAKGECVAFVDAPIVYDHRSLSTMARELQREDATACVELPVLTLQGHAAQLPPGSLASRLFRTEALRPNADDLRDLAASLEAKPLKKPVVILMAAEEDEHLDKSPEERPEPEKPQGSLFQRIKHALHKEKNRPVANERPAKKPAPKKKRIPTSEFYLNLDIDPNLVVVEGLGKQPRGNSLYIVQELQKPKFGHPRIAFSVTESTREYAQGVFAERGLENVTCVLAGSDEYKRALFSARVLFNEVDFPNWWIKKPHQVYVNIWHGTPLKKLGRAKGGIIHRDANASRNFTMADYVLCANEYSIEHILGDCDVLGLTHARALMLGYPRTGELFGEPMREQVRKRYGLGGKQVIAWMPTYREYLTGGVANGFLHELDGQLSPNQVLYVNLHHKTAAEVSYGGLEHVRPFPPELDTYEFLCGADVLVTDYSSIMFDFAVTRRNIVLYCPDRAEYESDRGLYRSVDELPFSVTADVAGLVVAIGSGKTYDDVAFLQEFTAHDSVENCERLCRLALLGDEEGVELRSLDDGAERPTFVVSDGLPAGPATDLLYELAARGAFGGGVYLSFLEQEVDKNLESAYPLVERVPLYATKGKSISERSEQQRLYNDLNPRAVIVLETEDAKRVRCFARFDVPTYLFVQPVLLRAAQADPKTLKALRLFAKWGSGLFALDANIAAEARELTGADVEVIETAEEFEAHFL